MKPIAYAGQTLSRTAPSTYAFPKWTGTLELRPSFPVSEDKAYGENAGELGVQASPNVALGYQQQFSNNYYNNNPDLENGPQLALADGFLYCRLSNIYKSGGTSLLFEPRVYFPTDESLRDKGMMTRVRTKWDLRHGFSNALAMHWIEEPILHIYDRAGAGSGTEASANPHFENRFTLALEAKLSRSLSIWFPTQLKSVRTSDFEAQAKNNDRWTHNFTIYPELNVALSQMVTIGVAFETASLMTDDLSKFQISDAFSKGRSQLIFRVAF